MALPRKKTLLRNVRITKDLDDILQKDAVEKGMSVNTLILMILGKYAKWDRFTDRYRFVTLTREDFRRVIGAIDDNLLCQIGKDIGSRLPKDFILFQYKKLSIEAFLKYQSLFSTHGQTAAVETTVENGEYAVIFNHEFGQKWSNYLVSYLTAAMDSMFGIVPRFDIDKSLVMMRFTPNQGAPS